MAQNQDEIEISSNEQGPVDTEKKKKKFSDNKKKKSKDIKLK